MPRFHFHLRSGAGLSRDEDGLEFPDLETAYLEAFRAARDLWIEMLFTRRDPMVCVFEITDGCDRLLLQLPFTEVLDCAQKRPRKPKRSRADQACAPAYRTVSLAAALSAEVEAARANVARCRTLLEQSPRPALRTRQGR
jgi:hypothetical protein